jgi:hypothetical protein
LGFHGSIGVTQKAFTALADFFQSSGGTKTTAFALYDFLCRRPGTFIARDWVAYRGFNIGWWELTLHSTALGVGIGHMRIVFVVIRAVLSVRYTLGGLTLVYISGMRGGSIASYRLLLAGGKISSPADYNLHHSC